MQTDRVAALSVSTMHPYQLENWCVQWERKRWGEAVSYTNEGDGIRTKSAREGGRATGPVPDLPLSRLRARLLKKPSEK